MVVLSCYTIEAADEAGFFSPSCTTVTPSMTTSMPVIWTPLKRFPKNSQVYRVVLSSKVGSTRKW
jgi:hypothetical protein